LTAFVDSTFLFKQQKRKSGFYKLVPVLNPSVAGNWQSSRLEDLFAGFYVGASACQAFSELKMSVFGKLDTPKRRHII